MFRFALPRTLSGVAALLATTTAALAQQPDAPQPATSGAPAAPSASAAAAAPAAPAVRATVFKLGLNLPSFGGYHGLAVPLSLSLERPIGPRWALTADASAAFTHRLRAGTPLYMSGVSLGAGARYYYGRPNNRPGAVRTGTYVEAQVHADFERVAGYDFINYRPDLYFLRTRLEALWGYQRSLGRHGFFDVGAGLSTQRITQRQEYRLGVAPTVRARIGFAF